MTLSVIETKSYWDDGLLFPKRVISEIEAANYLAELESYETATGGPVKWQMALQVTLDFPVDQPFDAPIPSSGASKSHTW